ncbi:tail tube terminator [Nitrososphaeria virus YSH_462411]|uniref:Tail tube terminator n=1 Tax=Nitrososphaeria virus YSH_462411 TaxID=3071321 RepID=A0A976YEW5_9CAUD|nr:tail tube terminator [Yangshan Harbor Nitrososphaeria virus]UVF62275.1 tail tube terminator [Nitrososphaeria virus YSH_462411]
MVTELDIWEIKARIEAILEANATLYDTTSTTGTKLVEIETGAPNTDTIPQLLPAAYITNDDIFDSEIEPWNVSSNVGNTFEHELSFLIIVMVGEQSPRLAENILDDFVKLIKETLKANYDLRHPSTGLDSKVASSRFETAGILNPSLYKSNQISGVVLRLRCKAYTS